MDFSSPVIIATLLGFLFTQVVGRFVDHHYDKTYRKLERNLQLRKLIGEETHNASLDELIRRQLNSYVIYEMGDVQKTRKHRMYLLGIGILTLGSLIVTIAMFQEERVAFGIIAAIVTFTLSSVYLERRSVWFRRKPAENTKYKALLSGGKYNSGQLMVDIAPVGNDSSETLDHPFLYIEDSATGRLSAYKRVRSTGNVSVSSGADTNLVTEYDYLGLYDGVEGRHVAGKNPIISSIVVQLEAGTQDDTNEPLIIVRPIVGAVSGVSHLVRLMNRKMTKQGTSATDEGEQFVRTYTAVNPIVHMSNEEKDANRTVPPTAVNPIVSTQNKPSEGKHRQ